MKSHTKRVLLVMGLGLLAIPVVTASLAYACTGLATISADPAAAPAGAKVTVNGSYFAPHDPSDVRSERAVVRMDSPSGTPLATAAPSSSATSGQFSVQITVPHVAPGEHVIIVTQNGVDGRPAYGTPARQVFTVTPSPAGPSAGPSAGSPAAAAAASVSPAGTPPANTPRSGSGDLADAIAACKRKHTTKGKKGSRKKRAVKKRAACVRKAVALS